MISSQSQGVNAVGVQSQQAANLQVLIDEKQEAGLSIQTKHHHHHAPREENQMVLNHEEDKYEKEAEKRTLNMIREEL